MNIDSVTITVENGTIELAPTPGHLNLIAEEGENGCEVCLRDDEKHTLAEGIRSDSKTDVELADGVVGWEPGRGLYVESYATSDLYMILSPEQREKLVTALVDTPVGAE